MDKSESFYRNGIPFSKALTDPERKILLSIARQSIVNAVKHIPTKEIDLATLSEPLQAYGASFVTLFLGRKLRGCIGALFAYQPLALDVQEHAVAAAIEDYRFPNVSELEIPELDIEISRLTAPVSLTYKSPDDLLNQIRPGVDGVIFRDGLRRATFLPQVWESLPKKEDFLSHLCQKMGAHPDLWRNKKLDVSVYEVEEFRESHLT